MTSSGYNQVEHLRLPHDPDSRRSRSSRPFMQQDSAGTTPLQLLGVLACLVAYGLVVVYSAVQGNETYSFTRQLTGIGIGAILMLIISRMDYRQLAGYTTLLLIVNVVLILSPHLPVIGVESHGARSWINLGMRLQPGEFAKITVILLDAGLIARYGAQLDDFREYLKVLGIMAVPFLCIMTQPDLGTGLVYLFIDAVALVMGGARLRHLLITLAAFIALIAAVFALDEVLKGATGQYHLLKDYQRSRLFVFMNQGEDSSDSGYNLKQAMIAVGSGGFLGKGFGNATQSSLGFVPEAPTDFIFCVLAEQFGFVGAVALLGLYLALVIFSIRIARNAADLHGTLIVACIVGMWLFQILENVGMNIGLMPITGIPLPFMSYGTSFMLVNFMLVGLIWSVYARRGA